MSGAVLSSHSSHAHKTFYQHEELTEEYQRYFSKPGVIGYYGFSIDSEEKSYCLCLADGEMADLGGSLSSVDKRLQEIYYAEQLDFFEPKTPIEIMPQLEAGIVTEQEEEPKAVKVTPKRQALLDQVNKIKTWGRGVIAEIAFNLGRKVGAVRQMLSVLTKKGLLTRVRRGQYALSSEQLALL